MPSEYSPLLRLELIGAGEQSGLWGDTTNKNLGTLLEQAVAGVAVIPLLASGVYIVEALDGTQDQARSAVLNFTGAPGGAVTAQIPSTTKLYVVRNDTNVTLTVKTIAQVSNPLLGGVPLLPSEATLVFCNGTAAVKGIQAEGVGVLGVAGGGTGKDNFAVAGFLKTPGGQGGFTSVANINLDSADTSGTLPAAKGGTGISSAGTAGNGLISTGAGWISGATVNTITGAGGITVTGTAGNFTITGSGASGVNTVSSSTIGVSPTAGNVVITLSGSNVINALGYTPASTSQVNTVNPTFSSSVTTPTYYVGNTSNYIQLEGGGMGFVTGGTQANKFTSSGLGTNNVVAAGTIGAGGLLLTNFNLSVRGTVPGQSASYFESYAGGSSAMGINVTGGSVFGIVFQYNATSSGQIVVTSGATSYQTTSDRRLKDNIVPLENSGDEIDALKPRQFTWKATGDTKNGFIADELQQVIPGAVSGEPDAVDAEGNPVYQGIDASTPEMIALIVCELQSLRKRVAELEAK